METITNLIKDTPIPKMVKVRQNFDKTCIPESDILGTIVRELDRSEIGGKIQHGQKIAITCGSRGINHNALMARAIVDFVKSKGAEPFIVAAMVAGGAQVVVFSSGRGTPTGNPIVPVIKITGNKLTFVKMEDNIDLDASPLIYGTKTLEELGGDLLNMVVETACGKQTKAESLGFTEMAIARVCNYV